MRSLRNPRLERGEVRIEDIELDIKSRDDIPSLLFGLQYLYSQEALRDRIFALMDEYILPGVNRKVGRSGMAMWSILVLAVVKQGLGCDFDRLHELANQHMAIRQQSTRLILKYRSCLDLKVIVWGKFFAKHEGLFRGHVGSIA